jgi:hypothetical protein
MSSARKFKTGYDVKGSRLEHFDSLTPTPEAALGEGGQHLVLTPVHYSENSRILTEERKPIRLSVGRPTEDSREHAL